MSTRPESITITLDNLKRYFAERQVDNNHWEGRLSSSALSTATAVFALRLCNRGSDFQERGLTWLARHQNADGGWGDTTKSFSNISTTALCWAALSGTRHAEEVRKAERWLTGSAGSLGPDTLARVIADRYGEDRTFSVPILTMLALAGRLGDDPWRHVLQLPFPLAALPFSWFRTIRLPVVSYALPALIAIGAVRHHHRPPKFGPLDWLYRLATPRAMRTLAAIQPETGGYLEATPLTSFVAMSLAGMGRTDHPVLTKAAPFLMNSMRDDGGWPIDTHLATWVTTLTVNALRSGIPHREQVRRWLLRHQYQKTHPYTQSPPGGWAWTPLSGGVPDGDDTPGALIALYNLGEADDETLHAARAGCQWLVSIQNGDGGIPTFCRGWGKLPFDRSSTDLTAHTLAAWLCWLPHLPGDRIALEKCVTAGLQFLIKSQQPNGAWRPLWFGNQHAIDVANLTYGTSRVLRLARIGQLTNYNSGWESASARGRDYLLATQNADGGWGGTAGMPSSVEETALALESLAGLPGIADDVIGRAADYLTGATAFGTRFDPEPIGFYFANLWYYEELYPAIYTAAALSAVQGRTR